MPESLSIAEMRAKNSPNVGRPESTVEMCLAQKVIAEVRSLSEERDQLVAERLRIRRDAGLAEPDADQPTSAPRRAGQPAPPRLAEIEARLAEIEARLSILADEMREHTGVLTLRAIESGEWRRWVSAGNTPREIGRNEQGDPIWHIVDEDLAYGFCNADNLFARLGDFAAAWNGEPLADGEWDWLASRASGGDLNEAVRTVVQMQEVVRAKAPLSHGPSSTTTRDETASTLPSA